MFYTFHILLILLSTLITINFNVNACKNNLKRPIDTFILKNAQEFINTSGPRNFIQNDSEA
jgi:hypothetical protein